MVGPDMDVAADLARQRLHKPQPEARLRVRRKARRQAEAVIGNS